ncbi:MAG TPA: amylo-alpha-1,6-glucosidase [Burkholderiales bacterium]|nr:amylo-alpha-1,6-glucosidase [Burkholderiales bacterium]
MRSTSASIQIDWRAGDDPVQLRTREWLVTNGLGGFASGTLLGPATRRYHGLFVPNLADPEGRYVLISRLDEEVIAGDTRVHLGGAEYLDERLACDTQHHLRAFRFAHLMPTWRYAVDDRVLEKTIVMSHMQNTVFVQYKLLRGEPLRLQVRPFVAFRRQDAVLEPRDYSAFKLSIDGNEHEVQLQDAPLSLRFGMRPTDCAFVADAVEEHDVLFRKERDRGYDHSENQYSPGYFALDLQADAPATFVATVHGWEALNIDAGQAIEAERNRVERLLAIAPASARSGFPAQLVMAADQFLVIPGSRLEDALLARASGGELRTVIAGYHWFGDWGRDTMISFEGLTLCTGRHREAGAILRTFAHYVRDGLLPNLFPEGAREALYHTVDATFWFFHAIERYRHVVGDEAIVAELWPTLCSIIDHHVRGTRYGIGVDPADGLIRAGAPGYQLTWMDAKVDDWVVTPRRGKPVEIQALWHNALSLMAEWASELHNDPAPFRERAALARRSFNARYWNEEAGHLYDVIDGEDGSDDPACRPNQIFSISLSHPVLDPAHWEAVVETVHQQLLTPYGLRTLNPEHPDYKRTYEGDLRSRDAAYHQGTVWPWLIGHYLDAWIKVHGRDERAGELLQAFPEHLRDAGIGSISEIFDATHPYVPRGCIAQAWSVAEVLRAWLKTTGDVGAPPSA